MRASQQLHRTAVRDIISVTEDASSIQDVMNVINRSAEVGKDWLSKTNTGSIAKRASNLVLVFPVLVSSSLKMKTAVLLSKAIERKCVSLLQLLFSATNLTRYRDTKDLNDYISKFHTNINATKSAITLDDFINIMDTMVATGEAVVVDRDMYDAVMESMKDINLAANDLLRESSVNDFKVTKTMFGRTNVTLEAGPTSNPQDDQLKKELKAYSNNPQDLRNQVSNPNMDKANELVPTMMTVNFVTMIDGQPVKQTGMIGVKAKMYPVDSIELMNRLEYKVSNSNTLFSLIKCSTKEKSFFRDFLFAVDKAKMDAINIAKGSVNTRLFRTLEKRASANNRLLLKRGDASPITTMILSQEEVEYMKKYKNIDLEKSNTAKVILQGYNLMGIIITDDSIEVAKMMFDDGEGMYETVTYDSLAKEDKNGDYKKIINLMAQMNK